MPEKVQITANVAKVLQVLLQAPTEPTYGYEVMEQLKFKSGQLYPILGRLEKAGWIKSHQEALDPIAAGRPPRRYYVMTPDGVAFARLALAELRAALGMQPGQDAAWGWPEGHPA